MCILKNNNSITNIVSKIDANYKSFLSLDNFSKANIFDKLSPSEKYYLFKSQEDFRGNNIKNYLNLSKYYDYIDENNADKYLYVESDNIQIKWPDNNGFSDDVDILENFKCDKVLVSRIEYDNLLNLHKTYRYIYNKGVEKFVNRDKLGNCFGFGDLSENNNLDSDKINNALYFDLSYLDIDKLSKESHISKSYIQKFAKKWPSNNARAIPKKNEGSNIICGEFNLLNYFKFIDALSDGNINKISNVLEDFDKNLGRSYIENYIKEYNSCKKYDRIFKKDTIYGYFGTVNQFGDLKGKANQINTLFNFYDLCELGIIKYIVFKNAGKDDYAIVKSSYQGA